MKRQVSLTTGGIICPHVGFHQMKSYPSGSVKCVMIGDSTSRLKNKYWIDIKFSGMSHHPNMSLAI
jgi:hypothetical protein